MIRRIPYDMVDDDDYVCLYHKIREWIMNTHLIYERQYRENVESFHEDEWWADLFSCYIFNPGIVGTILGSIVSLLLYSISISTVYPLIKKC